MAGSSQRLCESHSRRESRVSEFVVVVSCRDMPLLARGFCWVHEESATASASKHHQHSVRTLQTQLCTLFLECTALALVQDTLPTKCWPQTLTVVRVDQCTARHHLRLRSASFRAFWSADSSTEWKCILARCARGILVGLGRCDTRQQGIRCLLTCEDKSSMLHITSAAGLRPTPSVYTAPAGPDSVVDLQARI